MTRCEADVKREINGRKLEKSEVLLSAYNLPHPYLDKRPSAHPHDRVLAYARDHLQGWVAGDSLDLPSMPRPLRDGLAVPSHIEGEDFLKILIGGESESGGLCAPVSQCVLVVCICVEGGLPIISPFPCCSPSPSPPREPSSRPARTPLPQSREVVGLL